MKDSFAVSPIGYVRVRQEGFFLEIEKEYIHKGLACNVGLTYRYIYETWLPQSDYKLPLAYNFEYYGKNHFGPDNEESESEIYIPIERERPT